MVKHNIINNLLHYQIIVHFLVLSGLFGSSRMALSTLGKCFSNCFERILRSSRLIWDSDQAPGNLLLRDSRNMGHSTHKSQTLRGRRLMPPNNPEKCSPKSRKTQQGVSIAPFDLDPRPSI